MDAADRIKEFVAIDAEARRIGAVAERSRIREELLKQLTPSWPGPDMIPFGSVLAAIDNVCPEE